MKLLRMGPACFACVFFVLTVSAPGQITPEVAVKLRSTDMVQREEASRVLLAQPSPSPAVKDAIIKLLQMESFASGGSEDEFYGRYMGSLTTAVMKIADDEPQRSDVWPVLVAAIWYNGHAAAMPWFLGHSDKTAPYFLSAARGTLREVPASMRADALTGLARIIAYERDPATEHHLKAADVQVLEQTIRQKLRDTEKTGKLSENDEMTRQQAVYAVGMMGNAADLDLLGKIAATDPTYDSRGQDYPLRFTARLAAAELRKRLAATPKNANP